jgi:hypothetical protein
MLGFSFRLLCCEGSETEEPDECRTSTVKRGNGLGLGGAAGGSETGAPDERGGTGFSGQFPSMRLS